jgi:MFS family permease
VANSFTAPLAYPRFRALWIASVFSNVGGFIQAVAASWLMLDLTGSPVWVSAMAGSTMLPLLFLALPSGAVADLGNRRNILLVTQSTMLAAVVGMTVLALADLITPQLLLGLGLLVGVGQAFNTPVWMAMVPDLVPRSEVPNAIALNAASFNGARAVGPALGGIIVAIIGPGAAFAANAVGYLGILMVVASFSAAEWKPQEESSMSSAIVAGIRYARFSPSLRLLLILSAGFALTTASVLTLLPNITKGRLHGGAALYGVLLGAMGLGAVCGAATRGRAGRVLGPKMVPVAATCFGVAGLGVGLSGLPWLTALVLAGGGVFWVWMLATLNATVQTLSHSWVRGRALSLYNLAFSGIYPLGALAAGAVGGRLGVQRSVLVFSAGAVVLGLSALRLPIVGMEEAIAPTAAEDWDLRPHPDLVVRGGPILVLNTWTIDETRLDSFLEAMAELRLLRLRTGAFRWRLYRDVEAPRRMTEAYNMATWDDHLRHHQRIDAAGAQVIRRVRSFNVGDGPISYHMAAFDVADPARRPEWEYLATRTGHREVHESDGPSPLAEKGDDGTLNA